MTENKKTSKSIPAGDNNILLRPDLPTLFIDNFIIHKMRDGRIVLSGIQTVPEMNVEQVRCMITSAHALRLAEKMKEILSGPDENKDAAKAKTNE